MTAAELYSLDSYANTTLGRPVSTAHCSICGQAPKDGDFISYGGLCPPCHRKTRPNQEIVQLFRPTVRTLKPKG